jgi:hypothetical protein
MSETPILINAFQLKSYGGSIKEGSNFYFRYFEKKHFKFFKSIYIPFGPVLLNENGFEEFIDYVKKYKFTKFKIDLPLILDKSLSDKFTNYFINQNFKKTNYIHDNETLLVTKKTFVMRSRDLRYVRSSLRNYEVVIYKKLKDEILDEIYEIYLFSARRVGYKPKSKEIIKDVAEKGLTAVGINKVTGKIDGFLIGFTNSYLKNNVIDNVNENPKILQLIFTGQNDDGLKVKLGYGIHYELFNEVFDKHDIDIIDFHGGGKSQYRTYTGFKRAFGGEYLDLPGSFEKIILI